MDKLCQHCQIELDLVCDHDQSYVEVLASFKRDHPVLSESGEARKQKMSFRFYHNAFKSPANISFKQVRPTDTLEDQFKTYPDLIYYITKGQLWRFDMRYIKENVESVGVNDKLDFNSPKQLQYLEIFKLILDSRKLRLYLHCAGNGYAQTVELFKARLYSEMACYPFPEYISKSNRYV